ncbi:hypothetical protein [Brevibacillus sp. NRS-1366]|uniref:hypothetical protein n=1 Tax=Brevibacillus sp. NRS-1366 TaxID=3233899 RepID=UPI003D1C6CA9
MRVWSLSVVIALLLVSFLWGGFQLGSLHKDREVVQLRNELSGLKEKLAQANEQSETNQPTTPSSVAFPDEGRSGVRKQQVDRDAIVNAFKWTDDKGTGYEYEEVELTERMQDPQNRDYKEVLKRFVEQELQKELESFQTMSRTLNPRSLLVATTDHNLYEVRMKKWYTHDQIWTVQGYNTLPEIGKVNGTANHRILTLAEVDEEVSTWAKGLLASPEWKNEFLRRDGKTYLLIKSSGGETDSVELEDIRIWVEEMYVDYQAYEYKNQEDRSLINDYLLIEVPVDASAGVTFRKTVSVTE